MIEPTIEQDLSFLRAERHCCTDCIRRASTRIESHITTLTRERDEANAATLDLIAKCREATARAMAAEARVLELTRTVRALGGEL